MGQSAPGHGRPPRVRASVRGRVTSLRKGGLFKLELSILSFSRGRPTRNRVVFIISERVGVRRGKPPAKQNPLTWPYSLRPLRPPAARGGETPSEGFLLMKTTRFLAGPPSKSGFCQDPPRKVTCAAKGGAQVALARRGMAFARSRRRAWVRRRSRASGGQNDEGGRGVLHGEPTSQHARFENN